MQTAVPCLVCYSGDIFIVIWCLHSSMQFIWFLSIILSGDIQVLVCFVLCDICPLLPAESDLLHEALNINTNIDKLNW